MNDSETQRPADGHETSDTERVEDLYVGGLETEQEYCIIVGETSLCGKLYRRLGHPNGADFATHWDFEITNREDAEQILPIEKDLCKRCSSNGGWREVEPDSDRGEGL